ncbi:MAG: ATP synthase F1 subunit epsilon [Endomicrobium sp.]|jgi:F-type H+-transporting ATPase subunit epsilon|nr:ATP synthase F1 subunit epsilon [Endomicrobium sp.]
MKNFELEILSPQGVAFKGEVMSVSLPTSSGIITVLPGHTNLVTKLKEGEIIITHAGGEKRITVIDGFVEIFNNTVDIVSDFAVTSDDENVQKIEQAMKLAKDMKNKKQNVVDSAVIETQLKKAVYELKSGVGIKRKKI